MSDLKLERNVILATKIIMCGMTVLTRNFANGRVTGSRSSGPGRDHSPAMSLLPHGGFRKFLFLLIYFC